LAIPSTSFRTSAFVISLKRRPRQAGKVEDAPGFPAGAAGDPVEIDSSILFEPKPANICDFATVPVFARPWLSPA
jgi:hypothetical protein